MSKMAPIRSIRLAGGEVPASTVSPAEALNDLLEGNRRFVDGESQHPDKDASRRKEVVGGQHPPAAVLSCSDSRVPPEIVFDRGLGDLFVVRDAGNVAGPLALESLHYAVAHLGTRLIAVLGHTNCGAVTATVAGKTSDIPETARGIQLAVQKSKAMPGDPVENAIAENVRLTVDKLSTWKALAPMIKRGEIRVVGAIYHLDSGRVTLIDAEGGRLFSRNGGDASK